VRRRDFGYIVSILLLVSIAITGSLGYIQSQLDLRKFVPHRYFASTTLGLTALHVCLNGGRIWRYLHRRPRRAKPEAPGD
jgi:hypothetical protein